MTEKEPREPRRMPKNQRAYKTPSGKKARMVALTDLSEIIYLEAHQREIDVPTVYRQGDGTVLIDAGNLRKWRALRNPPTSGAANV